jgi:DNA/RNA endonuclease YhcR with UshA esterase domain
MAVLATTKVPADKAKDHIGETVTVYGVVKHVFYNKTGKAQPTYINFGAAYPDQTFTAVIFGKDLPKFNYSPKQRFTEETVYVTGKVILYKGKPEIIVTDPAQLEVKR